MTPDPDLTALGESPASPGEDAWARWLADLVVDFEHARPATGAGSPPGMTDCDGFAPRLVAGVRWLIECASVVREHSTLATTVSHPDHRDATMPPQGTTLPDPFPGEYRLIRVLGEGAFGTVWLAEHLSVGGRLVAIKTLKVAAQSTSGPQVLAALRKDAHALGTLDHPNVVSVYDLRMAGGEPHLVLRYVEGGSLADRLKRDGPLDWQDAARYVADVGEALLEAHARGVIHRDIKPANILWDAKRDEALLTDFGVSAHLTEPGNAAGTPAYMAPEAWEGRVSPALDVFGLAATLFQLVTGELPFPSRDRRTLIDQITQGLPDPDPRCRRLPEPLEQIIRAGLGRDPDKRPALRPFLDDLRGALGRLIADTLMSAPAPAEVRLKLLVSKEVAPGDYRPVVSAMPRHVGPTRDMKKVPKSPEQVRLRTGDRVRIEVTADHEGFVTVFNVGPSGRLNLLYPDGPPGPPPSPVRAGRPLHVIDVEFTPPAGRERLFAIWSRAPLRLEELESLANHPDARVSPHYQATRDMKRVKESIDRLPPGDRHAVVLELDHLSKY